MDFRSGIVLMTDLQVNVKCVDIFMVSKFLVNHLHCMWPVDFDADDELNRLHLFRAPMEIGFYRLKIFLTNIKNGFFQKNWFYQRKSDFFKREFRFFFDKKIGFSSQ